MKSIKRRFNNITTKNPYWSSHTCFAEAIKGRYFSKQAIHRWFQKLVEKDDYDKKDKKEILDYLVNLSNHPRTTENEE